MKKIILCIAVCIPLFLSTAFAQKVRKPIQVELSKKKSSGFEYGLGLTNRYIWRGLDLAESPALIPHLKVTLGGLSIMTTGIYALADKIDWNNENTEFSRTDVAINYLFQFPFSQISLGVVDYYLPYQKKRFLSYKKKADSHTMEANTSIKFNGFPLELFAAYNFLNDRDNSLYIDVKYNFHLKEGTFSILVGGTTRASSWYRTWDMGITNLAFAFSKEINILNSFVIKTQIGFHINVFREENHISLTVNF